MPFRCLLAVGLLAAAAGACSGDDEDDAVPLSVPPTEATTTTEAPTTSTTVDFETEVKLAALELLEIRNEVLMNPDPSRIDEFLSELCTCLDREFGVVERFATDGRRWAGPAVEPLAIRLDRSDQANPTFTVIARQPAGEIIGPSGAEPVAEVDLAPYFVSLIRASDGGWRINGLEGLTMERDAAQAIVREEGLP